ncbi:MAG: translocation/assembly module TamB domain-containing protein [Pseudomonadota bacterium]
MTETAPKAPKSNPRRWLVRSASVLGGVVLVAVGVRALGATGLGRDFVEARIEGVSPAGQIIAIDGLNGDVFGRFSIDSLTVTDADGVWLEVEAVDAKWSPLSLIRRRLVVDTIDIGTLDILRQPERETTVERRDTSRRSSFLKGGALGRLGIGRLETGTGLTGRATVSSAEASATVSRDRRALSVHLVPADAVGDRVDIDLNWPRGGALQGAVDVNAPAGGLIAGLARLAPDQGMGITLDASGDISDWTLTAAADIDGQSAFAMDLSGSATALVGTAQMDLAHHPLTAGIGDRIGEQVALTIGESGIGDTPTVSLQATSDRLSAVVSTDITNRNAPIAIVASLRDLGDSLGVPDLDAQIVRLAVLTRQTPGDWSLTGDLTLDDVMTPLGPVAGLKGPITIDLTGEAPALSLTFAAEDAALDGTVGTLLGQSPSLNLKARLQDSADSVTLDSVRLSGAHASLSGTGRAGLGGGDIDIGGTVRLDGAVAEAFPLSVGGDWRLQRTGDAPLEALFDVRLTDFTGLPEGAAALAGDAVALEARLALAPDGSLTLPQFALNGDGASLSGAGSRTPDGHLSLTLEGAADRFLRDDLDIADIALAADLSGPPDTLALAFNTKAGTLQTAGQTVDGVSLTMDGTLSTFTTFDGAVTLTTSALNGVSNGAPTLETNTFLSPEAWAISDLRASAFGLTAMGEASAPLGAPMAVEADLVISGTAGSAIGPTSTTTSPIRAVDAHIRLGDALVAIDADARLAPTGSLGAGRLQLSASGDRRLSRLSATFDSTLDTGEQTFPVRLDVDGELSGLDGDRQSLSVSPTLAVSDLVARAKEPWRVTHDGPTRRIEAAGSASLLGGTAEFTVDTVPDAPGLTFGYSDLTLAPVLALFDRAVVGGTLSGDLAITPAAETRPLAISLSGALTDLAAASRPDQPVGLTYSVDISPTTLTALAQASNEDDLDFTARASGSMLPAEGWPGVRLDGSKPLTYSLAGGGDIEALSILALPPSMALAGTLDLALEGQFLDGDTTANGRMSLDRGRFEHGDLGFILTDLAAVARVQDDGVSLDLLEGTGKDGGTVSAEGRHSFDGSETAVSLRANRLALVDRDEMEAAGSLDLSVEGSAEGYTVSGDIVIDRADIDPTQFEGAGYQTLDVRFEDPSDDDPDDPRAGPSVDLDITVRAPRRIFVEGQGLDAELSMDGTLTGPADDPTIRGVAKIVRGAFEFAGKRFLFEESEIRIDGDPLDAELDLRAVRSADDIRAIVTITGTPRAPVIALSAEPELPQDEILSRVLFGRSPTELTELEALQLASALASLAGGGGGLDIMGSLEDALGVDTLTLGQSAEGNTNVTTGKYLSEDVYLQVRTDGVGQPTLIIEWTPRSNLEIETDLTPSEGQGASIEWQREFD